ncbi:MAG: hypothetical protein WC797_04555 [Candidatus Paceibacterota bacterium]|jgi:methionyl-tRNA synthetase
MISIEDFKKGEIRFGTIVKAEKLEGADKLLVLGVDLGEESPRQILSGIALYFPEPSVLVGRQMAFVTNLEPKELRGHMSHGMILAATAEDGIAFLEPSKKVPNGTLVK